MRGGADGDGGVGGDGGTDGGGKKRQGEETGVVRSSARVVEALEGMEFVCGSARVGVCGWCEIITAPDRLTRLYPLALNKLTSSQTPSSARGIAARYLAAGEELRGTCTRPIVPTDSLRPLAGAACHAADPPQSHGR